jgi:hypothetical protein
MQAIVIWLLIIFFVLLCTSPMPFIFLGGIFTAVTVTIISIFVMDYFRRDDINEITIVDLSQCKRTCACERKKRSCE